MRTKAEWNVDTHISRARPPTRAATRSFISPAALLVNVMAMIWSGLTPPAASRYAIRCVSTRVLPDPATMSSGEPRWTTAARCGSLSAASSCSGSVDLRRGCSAAGRAAGAGGWAAGPAVGSSGVSDTACIALASLFAVPTLSRPRPPGPPPFRSRYGWRPDLDSCRGFGGRPWHGILGDVTEQARFYFFYGSGSPAAVGRA